MLRFRDFLYQQKTKHEAIKLSILKIIQSNDIIKYYDIIILNDEMGKPFLKMSNEFKAFLNQMGLTIFDVSISYQDKHTLIGLVYQLIEQEKLWLP